jgi:diacylglycerol kinase (ATP)
MILSEDDMKHLFIVNPIAGKGKALKLIPQIRDIFAGRQDEYLIEVTKKPGHATEIVREYVKNGKYRIYSVGGDGTLNEVLNGIVNSESSLAIIPYGSGNDFIKSIANSFDRDTILEKTVEGHEETVDLVRVNDRYFINIASVGFDAEVAAAAERFKKIPYFTGSLAYVASIISTVFRYKNHRLMVTIDEKQFHDRMLLTAIANGRFYGGGMIPAPQARIDDGELDICLIDALGKAKILALFPQFMKGRHGKFREVHFYKGKTIKIKSENEIALNFDGEVQKVKEAVFEIIPNGIKIVIPAY